MSLKGKVDRVKLPIPPKTNYGICIEGVWYNTFSKELGTMVSAGDLVEFTAEVNDKGFNNLLSLKIIEKGTGQPAGQTYTPKPSYSSGPRVSRKDPEEERRINRMACINSSIAYWKVAKDEDSKNIVDIEGILRVAEIFYKWVRKEEVEKPKGGDIGAFI